MTSVQVPTSGSFIELTRKDHTQNPRTLRVEILCPGFVMTDPQALVDALAKLFPDVKPSPPWPKAGDRVAGQGHAGTVKDVDGVRVMVRIEGTDGAPAWWRVFHANDLTVVERGES